MLDEVLSPQERDVVARARAFAEQHVAPHAARWEWERRYPLEAIQAACAQGLNTIELAREHGGQGLSFSCKLRAFEEISRGWMGIAGILGSHSLACRMIGKWATDEQKARFIAPMLRGEVITDAWKSDAVREALDLGAADLLDHDVVGLTQDREALLGDLTDDADREAGAGERLAPHDLLGETELLAFDGSLPAQEKIQELEQRLGEARAARERAGSAL